MVGMADTVEYTEGEMVKVPMIRANIPTIGQDRVINAATTASSAVKRERELALPTAITISLYLKPINININLARVHNNGTNTITLNATVTGPSICNAKIGASVSYRGDEYGIPTQQDVSDIK